MTEKATIPAFAILGPLEVQGYYGPVRLTAARHRAVLALLLLHHNRLVSASSIVDAVWPEGPPATVSNQVLTVISTLRRLLGDAARRGEGRLLVTRQPGYVLRLHPDQLDLTRFDALVYRADSEIAAGRTGDAADALRQALALWRGPVLADVTAPFALAAARNLEERRLSIAERLADIELVRGNQRVLLPLLNAILAEHPLNETLRARLMLALYRCGDVVGALNEYRSARQTLSEQLGLEPGPELAELQRRILQRDPELLPPSTMDTVTVAEPRPPRPRPSQLRRTGPLVGRTALAEEIRQALLRSPGPPVVSLHGPGGVGKSALALHVAHGVADAFPDGQLYVDLRGSSPNERLLSPGEVLGWFLRALGTPASELPAAVGEAAAEYQSLLASRRVLVVLDNAADARQVAPLLPAQPGCAAIVTSRSVLSTLDAMRVPVELLDESDSVHLLAQSAGADRARDQFGAAAEIVRLCGRLRWRCASPVAGSPPGRTGR